MEEQLGRTLNKDEVLAIANKLMNEVLGWGTAAT
jgi:hypothetical protein